MLWLVAHAANANRCDSLVNGNIETFNIWKRTAEATTAGSHYVHGKQRILRELACVKHEFIIPKGMAA